MHDTKQQKTVCNPQSILFLSYIHLYPHSFIVKTPMKWRTNQPTNLAIINQL